MKHDLLLENGNTLIIDICGENRFKSTITDQETLERVAHTCHRFGWKIISEEGMEICIARISPNPIENDGDLIGCLHKVDESSFFKTNGIVPLYERGDDRLLFSIKYAVWTYSNEFIAQHLNKPRRELLCDFLQRKNAESRHDTWLKSILHKNGMIYLIKVHPFKLGSYLENPEALDVKKAFDDFVEIVSSKPFLPEYFNHKIAVCSVRLIDFDEFKRLKTLDSQGEDGTIA